MNKRYKRNITVIGEDGQQALASSSVFVIGCGALGGQLAMLLAGAGVGKIGIADFDTIDITNLQRQLFFSETEAGERKADVIARRMRALNSEIEVVAIGEMIRNSNADTILRDYDLIVDATDNPATKYFVDEVAHRLAKPCCIGGVAGWRGQVMTISADPTGMRYVDVFPAPDADPSMLPCEIEGVMGPAASTVASLQAAEVLKMLTAPSSGPNRLIAIDLSVPAFNVLTL